MREPATSDPDSAVVVRTSDMGDLGRIAESNVQAVIYEPQPLPSWLAAVAAAVESGALVVARTVLPHATADDLAGWLAGHVPDGALAPDVHDSLIDDMMALVGRLARGTGASRFMLRVFTGAPTTECGFHVDTVPPGGPPWGLLRVYNGAGTEFVHPDNLTSVADFYRYLSRRERLERDRRAVLADGDAVLCDALEREILELDAARSFVARAGEVLIAPAGAIVAFKHLDVRLHWTAHAKAKAWIHCSPMQGTPRLVVNVTSSESAPRRLR